MRKVAVITGTRADYGIFRPVLYEIQKSSSLSLSLIVTGMHLSGKFGHSVDEIEKDGFTIEEKIPLRLIDTVASMAQNVGDCINGFTGFFKRARPDVILILGDRGEMLAGAITGIYLNIPVAHIHGGEVSGNVDEAVRHAITKLSHIHFPATQESAGRIRRLGEDEFRIHVVGAPALDTILSENLIPKEEIAQMFDLDANRPIILAVQHPVTTEFDDVERQMGETMEALTAIGEQTVIVYPNADAGGQKMIDVINRYRNYPYIHIYKNINHIKYLSLMRSCDLMIGNSSSSIIEAPSFKVPVVNVGTRQLGRQRAENVIDVDYDRDSIFNAARTALHDEDFRKRCNNCVNPYGNGKAGEKIVKILEELEITPELLQKKIIY